MSCGNYLKFTPEIGSKILNQISQKPILFVTTPTSTQHNLKTVVGLDPPHKLNSSLHEPQNNIIDHN